MTTIQNPSLPKHKIKFLLLEGISESAVQVLAGAGYENVERLKTALDGNTIKKGPTRGANFRYLLPNPNDERNFNRYQ